MYNGTDSYYTDRYTLTATDICEVFFLSTQGHLPHRSHLHPDKDNATEDRQEISVSDPLHQHGPPGETRIELLSAAEEHEEALHQQHPSCGRVPDGQEEEGCLKVHEGDRPGALRTFPSSCTCHLRHLVPGPLVHEARRRQLDEAECGGRKMGFIYGEIVHSRSKGRINGEGLRLEGHPAVKKIYEEENNEGKTKQC